MNYLAHAFLSPAENEYILAGNLITDMVKGPLRRQVDERFLIGMELHHRIDHFTDQHEAIMKMKTILYPRFSKYAPVVSDVYMDHLLVVNWSKFSNEDVVHFIKSTYHRLNKVIRHLPHPIYSRVDSMIRHDWLSTYLTLEGIDYVFNRMSPKLSEPQVLNGAGDWLISHQEKLELLFLEFMPSIINYIKDINYFNA